MAAALPLRLIGMKARTAQVRAGDAGCTGHRISPPETFVTLLGLAGTWSSNKATPGCNCDCSFASFTDMVLVCSQSLTSSEPSGKEVIRLAAAP